jgi:hypothetical protein
MWVSRGSNPGTGALAETLPPRHRGGVTPARAGVRFGRCATTPELIMRLNPPRLIAVAAAALAPVCARADLVDSSDVTLTAFANYSSSQPPRNDASLATGSPFRGAPIVEARALVNAGSESLPFPHTPTQQVEGFASAAGDNFGTFGVGVSGFFFIGSLPPNALAAGGTFAETLTNNSSTDSIQVFTDFLIPQPTTRFFGIGNFFPPNADPARDASASVEVRMFTHITHPDGTVDDETAFDYGIRVARDVATGTLVAREIGDFVFETPTEFDEPDGSFGFSVPALHLTHFLLGDMGPGDVLDFTYDYFARVSTGFGETAVFAASGDPFDLNAGGRVDLAFEGPAQTPEPATLSLLGTAALALWPFTSGTRRIFRARRRRPPTYTSRSRWQ